MSALHEWKQGGVIFVWRYSDNPPNYPGLQFLAAGEAEKLLGHLIECLRAAPPCSYRIVQLTPPRKST